MIIEILFPAKSPTMTEGTLVSWRIKPGDQVKTGQVIAELQTDKAVLEWESLDAGHVGAVLVEAGAQIPVNTIAVLLTSKPGEDVAQAVAKAKATNTKLLAANAASAAPAAPAAAPAAPSGLVAAPALAATPASALAPGLPKGVRISPVAAKLAAAGAIDLRQLKGSGPDGRIVRRDVEAAARNGTARIAAGTAKPERPRLAVLRADAQAVVEVPFTPMRQIIGKRLLEAKTTIPHFYVSESIDAGALVALREQVNLLDGLRVTVNDLVLRATALALRVHPRLNATLQGGSVRQLDSVDLSVAVAIPDGLITPIVARAHAKSVRQLGEEVRMLAKKAVDGKLKPEEFQGGSFTVSNLGMFGISDFAAIINPPQVAILAVAGIKDEPVVRAGAVVAGKVLRVTVSADHRAVDGAAAAAFLKTLRELLENPATLLV